MILVASSSGQARAVRLRTKPRLPLANAYLAMLSSFAVSMICTTSLSPEVRKICLISQPHFLARSLAACARLRSSLISRMPRSVKFKVMMNSMSFSHGIAMSFSGGEHQSKRVTVQGRAIPYFICAPSTSSGHVGERAFHLLLNALNGPAADAALAGNLQHAFAGAQFLELLDRQLFAQKQ